MRLSTPVIVAISGFCILLLALLCSSVIFPELENYLISKETAFVEGSKTFETWKKIPFPFKLKIYFLNVTNVDDFQMGAKPTFREIGPYVYDEFREREVLAVSEDNDTVRYNQKKTYFFNREDSGCRTEEDVVTIINTAAVGIAHKIYKLAPDAMDIVNDALPFLYPGIKNIFVTNTVRNILFDGVTMSCGSDEVAMICDGLKKRRPPSIRPADNNKDYLVAMFHHMNGSVDGPYEMQRGLKDSSKGQVVGFKDNNMLTLWTGDCNTIQGTDLTLNPNLNDLPPKIYFFASDFCRSFSVKFDKELVYLGLKSYKFKNSNLFHIEKNCFCDKNPENEVPGCTPAGTMDVSPCTGSSVVLSQPHFLNAEKSLLDEAQGLAPNENRHGTFIIMEPKTGLALVVKTRFQMNVYLQDFEDVDLLANVSAGFFPLLWLENGAEVPHDIVDEIRENFNKLMVFDAVKYFLIVLGAILLAVSIMLAMSQDKKWCFTNKNNSIASDNQMAKIMNLNANAALARNWENINNGTWKIVE
ncbi:Sensory neuron membrane protein 1-like Protein [Tribolium castaneum]|uniref:Sensory neuron membrane protein 1-like Protein n=1 Tax=Tribolium castaneum TaxID=7070 RepID=D2A0C3_TRICA|nr:Sensory neuron membrane protein 1-like Protein [Tribolium castaneum]